MTAAWSPRVAYGIAAVGVAILMGVFVVRPIDQIELEPAEAEAGDPDDQELPQRSTAMRETMRENVNAQTVTQRMTEISPAVDPDLAAAEGEPDAGASRAVAVVHTALLAVAVVLAVQVAPAADWDLRKLAILIVLAVISNLTSTPLLSGRMNVSGAFLGVVLAAVVLGGAPAAIVGAVTISVGWLRWRERAHFFRQNLVMYIWFPLLSGILFHWWARRSGPCREERPGLLPARLRHLPRGARPELLDGGGLRARAQAGVAVQEAHRVQADPGRRALLSAC